jgi:uroporphyrin-3 C-methyltransferase
MVKKIYFIVLVVIVILLAGGCAAAGYYFWKMLNDEKQKQHQVLQQVHQEMQTVLQQDQQEIQKGLQQDQQEMQIKINSLETQVSQQHSQLEEFQAKLNQMTVSEQRYAHQENLNEIAYLLDLANLYLQINHDPQNAIKSLQLAQHSVQTLADPRLLSLQRALASDINSLNDVKTVDTANLLVELQTLSESIGRLSLIPHPLNSLSSAPAQPITEKNHPNWLNRAWQSFWQNFQKLFSVSYRSNTASSLPPPQQREWVQENIAFTLAQAQWAVLQKQPALYQQSLTQVRQSLETYYPDTPERQKILNHISQLFSIDIAPTLPNIDASLSALQIALQTRISEPNPQPAPASMQPPSNSSGSLTPVVSPGIEI